MLAHVQDPDEKTIVISSQDFGVEQVTIAALEHLITLFNE